MSESRDAVAQQHPHCGAIADVRGPEPAAAYSTCAIPGPRSYRIKRASFGSLDDDYFTFMTHPVPLLHTPMPII